MNKEQFVKEFANLLEENGDMFFSSGDIETDYNLITSTLNMQGFWSGATHRYFFNEDLSLTGMEEKRYG